MNQVTKTLDVHPWVRTLSTIVSLGIMLGVFSIWVNGAVVAGEENKKDIESLTKKVEKNEGKLSDIKTITAVTEKTVDRIEKDIDSIDKKLDKVLEK